MATNTEIPVSFTPEAAERIADLGVQSEVQQMIEHTKEAIADLEAIDVEHWYDYEVGGPPNVTIVAWRPGAYKSPEDNATWDEWISWRIKTVPLTSERWVGFELRYRDDYGR